MTAATQPPRPRRGDIDGLRAVAIVLVVAFHVGLSGFSGGFVGVDVFFVISGYLITSHLVAETDRSDRPRLGRFWARRIRRLVPALGLMLLVVLILALLVLPYTEWGSVAAQARQAALYVSNLAFARQATNYFAPNVDTSLFLHTWSLGVEEQFYLLWPLLVTAVCLAVRRASTRDPERRGPSRRAVLAVVFALTFAVSLGLCLVQTSSGSAYAFFGLPARAWEFAAAGLLALAPAPTAGSWRRARLALATAGLVAIGVATWSFNQDANYPGWRALVPVAGTLAVIAAGMNATSETSQVAPPSSGVAPTSAMIDVGGSGRTNPASAALAAAPLQWVGRVSYSWYLWHWPLILLAVQATRHDTLAVRSLAAVVSLGVAAAAQAVVEDPARFDPRLLASSRLTYTMGAAATVLVLLFSLGVDHAADAQSRGPGVTLAEVKASGHTACTTPGRTDGISYCLAGDLTSRRTVVLVGDSHAWHWIPAFDQAAKVEGLRIVVRWHSICPATPVPVVNLQGKRATDCDQFHADTARLITELHPTAVVASESEWYWQLLILPGVKGVAARAQRWGQAYQDWMAGLRREGIALGSVVDTPRNADDPIDCLAQLPADVCTTPVSQALGPQHLVAVDKAAARAHLGHVPVLDVNGDICSATTCRVVANGQYVYVDHDHLYRGFVLTEVPKVESFLVQVVDSR